MRTLFTAMAKLDSTLLRFTESSAEDGYDLFLGRDTRPDVEWEHYGVGLGDNQVLLPSQNIRAIEEPRKTLEQLGAGPALEKLISLLKKDRHHQLAIRCELESGSLFVQSRHSSTLATHPEKHCLYVGGLRRESIDRDELEVIQNTLQHARTMSHKNAFADIPYDGCKLTVMADPLQGDYAFYGWLGFCINQSRAVTGPEMGLGPEEADVLRGQFTQHMVGGVSSSLGPTSWSAAEGMMAAGIAAFEHLGDDTHYRNKTVGIQGVGEVGSKLAELVLEHGANVVLTDTIKARVESFVYDHPHFATRMRYVPSDEFVSTPCDLLIPCATEKVLHSDDISKLQCRILLAIANNELNVENIEDEIEYAQRLQEAGILYQIAWVHNIGGVIQALAQYEQPDQMTLETLMKSVARRVHSATRKNFTEAKEKNISPTLNAYRTTLARLYGDPISI